MRVELGLYFENQGSSREQITSLLGRLFKGGYLHSIAPLRRGSRSAVDGYKLCLSSAVGETSSVRWNADDVSALVFFGFAPRLSVWTDAFLRYCAEAGIISILQDTHAAALKAYAALGCTQRQAFAALLLAHWAGADRLAPPSICIPLWPSSRGGAAAAADALFPSANDCLRMWKALLDSGCLTVDVTSGCGGMAPCTTQRVLSPQ